MKHYFLSLILLVVFCSSWSRISAQAPDYPLYGPYNVYSGPYIIRVYVNYVQPVPIGSQWTNNVDLAARTAGIFNKLNSVYNQHNIYFVGSSDVCSLPYQVITQDNYTVSNLHPDALDIFDRGNTGAPNGNAFTIPSLACEMQGAYSTLPASQSEVLIHEVGHCLGLSHTHTGTATGDCQDTPTGLCTNTTDDCNCCGDLVCDTDIAPQSLTASSDCLYSTSPTGLPIEVFTNFMSYTVPGTCRDRFTTGQVKRMWKYLTEAPALQAIQQLKTNYPTTAPSALSGSIIIESGELHINTPLQMMPGAYIRVKKGAKLKVSSTITAACNKMWQGIIVEGNAFDPTQSAALQGQVELISGAIIEHAQIAISVQDIDGSLQGLSGTGGGIVRIGSNTLLRNNTIGVQFGAYGPANKSTFLAANFTINNDYRGPADKRPRMIVFNAVKGIDIRNVNFKDERSSCAATNLTTGIESYNSGFVVANNCNFEQLYRGISADQLVENNGGISITGSAFKSCYIGVELRSSGSFTLSNNSFLVRTPAGCINTEITGAKISGNTPGFNLYGNTFYNNETELNPAAIPIGIDCAGLGEGLNNVIFKNTFSNLLIGNRAAGNNGYDEDGLHYLCNTNTNLIGGSDFSVISGSVRRIQGRTQQQTTTILPTGNTFSGTPTGLYCTFVNKGLEVEYYYYDGDPAQNPGIPDDVANTCEVTGFKPEDVNQTNSTCIANPGCVVCPSGELEPVKSDFNQNQDLWISKRNNFHTISDTAAQAAELEAIKRLRLALNKDGNRILSHYALDTLPGSADSLLHWLGRIQTYGTDLRLARHHFFSGNYSAHDLLRSQIPLRYPLEVAQMDELDRLDDVYNAVKAYLLQGGALNTLPDSSIDILQKNSAYCDESGFLSAILLRYNGLHSVPECAGYQQARTSTGISTQLAAGRYALLQFSPNPAHEQLRISYPEHSGGGQIRLYDMQGKLQQNIALPEGSSSYVLPVQHLPEGIYFAHWLYAGTSGVKKIVIAH